MAMESGSLELKVMFCKDVKAFNFFQKLSVYTQVSVVSDDPQKKLKQNQQQRTPADKEGDGNPEWKHEMRFDLKEISFHDCDHIFVHFELKHEGVMFGDKTIGEVRVPLKDLLLESNGVVRFVEYEVRNAEGKSNGVLSFSYKVNGNSGTFIGTDSPRIGITGYQIAHQHHDDDHHHHDADQGYGIHYPPIHAHSSPPGIAYTPFESHNSQQETVSTPQAGQYSSPRWQNPHQESYYPQPATNYYPPPPLPPPPPGFSYPPPPPPPMAHGGYYHHPHPWQPEPPHMGFHTYSMPGTWGAAAANMHPYGNGETSPNGFDHRSSSWNGRSL